MWNRGDYMKNYEIKNKQIKLHNVLFAATSEVDYEMERLLILEDMPDTAYNEYVLVEGFHCSCYGFNDTNWDGTLLTKEELLKILDVNDYRGLRKKAKMFLKEYFTNWGE